MWIGNNDIHNLYGVNIAKEIDEIMNILFESINKLYNDGARNILLLSIFNKNYVLNKNINLINDVLKFNDNIKE